MSIKLIALDIDDTLVNSAGKLEGATIAAIQKAKDRGIKVVLTTGRPLKSTEKLLNQLKLNDANDQYVINYHGTLIQTTSGKMIASNPLNFDGVEKASNYIKDTPDIDFVAETNDEMFLTKPEMTWYAGFECSKNHYQVHFRTIEQMRRERDQHTFYKMMFIGAPKRLDQVQKNLPDWLLDDFKTARTEVCFFDMINKKVSKGWAVKTLSEKLGFSPDEVMAVGDGDSDIPMIKFAGTGVAMKNGTKDLLKATNLVTDDQNHAGVAKAIEKYAL